MANFTFPDSSFICSPQNEWSDFVAFFAVIVHVIAPSRNLNFLDSKLRFFFFVVVSIHKFGILFEMNISQRREILVERETQNLVTHFDRASFAFGISFVFSQSARNLSRPMLVSGCEIIFARTSGGIVTTCAPIFAASTT